MPRHLARQELRSFAPDEIDVGERLRPLDAAHVQRLATSIREIGLQTPITVRIVPDRELDTRVILVAGAHRLAAMEQVGAQYVDCFVAHDDPDFAEPWEIDENFARQELSDAQRAEHHARREAILVRKGEVAAPGRGGDRTSNGQSGRSSYTAKAAADLGQPERTVRRDLHRGKVIAPDVLADVAGSPLDKGVVLDELASTPRDEQRAKLAEITERRATPRPAPHTNAAAAEVASTSTGASINPAWFAAALARMQAAESCDELQEHITQAFGSIGQLQGQMTAQLAALQPFLALVHPPTDLPSLLSWVQNLITALVGPQAAAFAKLVAQEAALASEVTSFASAVSTLEHECSVTLPTLPGVVVPSH